MNRKKKKQQEYFHETEVVTPQIRRFFILR